MPVSIGEVVGTLTLRHGSWDAGLKAASSQLDALGKKWERIGSQLTNVGTRLSAVVTLPLLAVGGAAIKTASDFESSFAGVRKTVNATEEEFAKLRQGLRDMAKETPTNVNELNRIAEAAGQLGIENKNIIAFTQTIADLGVATNLTTDAAATGFARLANITGLSQTQFQNLGSAIVALGNELATTEAEILDFSLRMAGAGDIAGLTEAQILGIGAAMSSVGVEAEAGGTAVQKVLLGMTAAVAQGNADLAIFASTAGMSAQQFADAWRTDAAGAFTAFVEGLGRQGDAAFQTLEELNLQDQRLIRSFLSLANAGDLLARSMDIGTDAFAANTALAKEAGERYKTFESQLTLFWNRLKDVSITLGEALIPVLLDTLNAIEPLVEKLGAAVRAFAALPEPVRATALALGAVAAAAGPVLLIAGQMALGWGGLVKLTGSLAGGLFALGNTVPVLTARLWLMNAAAKSSILTLSGAGGLILALGALAVAIHVATNRWKEYLDAQIAANVETANLLRTVLPALRSGGVVSRDVLQQAQKDWEALKRKIEETKATIDQLSRDPDQDFLALSSAREELGRLEKALSVLEKSWSDVKRVADQTPSDEWRVTAPRAVRDFTEAQKEAIKSATEMVRVQEALAEAATSGNRILGELADKLGLLQDFDLKKLPPTVRELIARLADAEVALRAYEARLEAVGKPLTLATRTTEVWAQTLRDARFEIQATIEPLGLFTKSTEPVGEGIASMLEHLRGLVDELPRFCKQALENFIALLPTIQKELGLTTKEVERLKRKLTEELDVSASIIGEGWVEMARTMADAFGAAFEEMGSDAERIVNQLVQLLAILEQIGKATSIWQRIAGGAALGGGIGSIIGSGQSGAGGALGGLLGSLPSEKFLPKLAEFLGPYGPLIGAALGGLLGSLIKKGADEALATVRVEGGKLIDQITKAEGGLGSAMRDITHGVIDAINGALSTLGGSLQSAEFGFKIRDDVITVFVAGLRRDFRDAQEAINFAMLEVFKNATILGVSPEVQAAIKTAATQAGDSIEAFQRDLLDIATITNAGLTQAAAAAKAQAQEFKRLVDVAERLGLSTTGLTEAFQRLQDVTSLEFGGRLVSFVEEYFGKVAEGEELKRRLEELNFQIRLAQLRLEFAQLNALGVLSAAVVENAQRLFAIIDAGIPTFGGFTPVAPDIDRGSRREERRRRRQELEDEIEAAFDAIASPLEETRQRFEELGERLTFLQRQVDAGKVSVERFGQALSELGQAEFVNLADNLVGFVERYYGEIQGMESFRLMAEQARFALELGNLNLQFRLLQELGALTATQVAAIQGLINFINNNLPLDQQGAILLNPVPPLAPPAPPQMSDFGGGANFGGIDTAVDRVRAFVDAIRSLAGPQSPMAQAVQQIDDMRRQFLALSQFEQRRAMRELGDLVRQLGATSIPDLFNRLELDRLRDLQREMLAPLLEFSRSRHLTGLTTGTAMQQFEAARASFQRASQAALAGGALDPAELASLAERVVALGGTVGGGGAAAFLERQVQGVIERILGESGITAAELRDPVLAENRTHTGLLREISERIAELVRRIESQDFEREARPA